MNWLTNFVRPKLKALISRKETPENLWLKCPKCGHDMREEQLDEVTIDRCTFCEGFYFDAGELDRIYLKKAEERRSLFRRLLGI